MAKNEKQETKAVEEAETQYSKAELLAAYYVFGVSREFLAAALHGVAFATKAQAEALVKELKTKGVNS